MRIEKSFGRVVLVDLVSGVTNRKPLQFEISDPPTIFVRMPHGPFSVRVQTPAPAELRVELDNVPLLTTKLNKGEHLLTQADSALPLFFGDPDCRETMALLKAAQAAAAEQAPQTEGENTEPQPERIVAPSQGLVVVSIRLSDITAPNSPQLPPDEITHIFFQLNPPGKHEVEMAGLLSKVVEPPAVNVDECIADDGGNGRTLPHVTRHCSCKH